MKLALLTSRRRQSGSALMVTAVTAGIMGIMLASHLTLVAHQRRSVARSQLWNECIAVAEAGVEEALMNLNVNTFPQLTWHSSGWSMTNTQPWGNLPGVTRTLGPNGDRYYSVTIAGGAAPVIRSDGYVRHPQTGTWLKRSIEVTTKNTSRFPIGILARGRINMNGNNVVVDSFDSTSALYSLNGMYDASRRKTNGDIATILGVTDAFSAGNNNIYGSAATGPGGTVSVGPNGFVLKGIRDDANFEIPDAEVPFGTAAPPIIGAHGGTNYKFYLGTGDYQVTGNLSPSGNTIGFVTNGVTLTTNSTPQVTSTGNGKNRRFTTNWVTTITTNLNVSPIKDALVVNGDARLYVTGSMDLSASYVFLNTNSTLEVYVGSGSLTLSGNSFLAPTRRATNITIIGLPGVTGVAFSGNAQFTGGLYAPNANLQFNGGGNNQLDFVGALVVSNITLNGHFSVHYDEAMRQVESDASFVISGWREY